MKKNYDVDDVGKVFLWCIILPFVMVFVANFLISLICSIFNISVDIINNPIYTTIETMFAQVAMVIVFIVFNKRKNIDEDKACRFNSISFITIFLCVILGVVGMLFLNPIANLWIEFLKLIGVNVETVVSANLLSGNEPWCILIFKILLYALTPAIFEELIFRGIILNGLKTFGKTKAILLSSLLFALMHGNPVQFVYTFLFGILFAYIDVKADSILPSMIIHFVSNGFSLVCEYFHLFDFELSLWLIALLAVVLILALIGIVYLFGEIIKKTSLKTDSQVEMSDLGKIVSKGPQFLVVEVETNGEKKEIVYNYSTKNLKISIWISVVLFVLTTVMLMT